MYSHKRNKTAGQGMHEVQRQMTEKTHKDKKKYTRTLKHKKKL